MYELRKKTPKISRKKSKGNGKNLRLVDRDFEILRFILEMKSCYSDQIWERFYKSSEIGIKYCQNRLSRLRRSEYLESHFTHDGPVRHYTATNKARDIVINFFGLDENEIPEARKTIDLRQFTHDKGLVWMRIFLENIGLIDSREWESETSFKHRVLFGKDLKKFKIGVVPDAVLEIYLNNDLCKVAIEFEYTLKSRAKRKEKVNNLFPNVDSLKENKWPYKVFVFGNKIIEKAYRETFRDIFLERAKAFNFSIDNQFFREKWKNEELYFGSHSLRCIQYDDFAELYKAGKSKNFFELFKTDIVYSESKKLLLDNYHQREIDCVAHNNRLHDENVEIEKKRRIKFIEDEKREMNKNKGLFSGLFS